MPSLEIIHQSALVGRILRLNRCLTVIWSIRRDVDRCVNYISWLCEKCDFLSTTRFRSIRPTIYRSVRLRNFDNSCWLISLTEWFPVSWFQRFAKTDISGDRLWRCNRWMDRWCQCSHTELSRLRISVNRRFWSIDWSTFIDGSISILIDGAFARFGLWVVVTMSVFSRSAVRCDWYRSLQSCCCVDVLVRVQIWVSWIDWFTDWERILLQTSFEMLVLHKRDFYVTVRMVSSAFMLRVCFLILLLVLIWAFRVIRFVVGCLLYQLRNSLLSRTWYRF